MDHCNYIYLIPYLHFKQIRKCKPNEESTRIIKGRDEWKNVEEVWTLIQNLQQDPSTPDTFIWNNDSLC